jgi:hypothetical protein
MSDEVKKNTGFAHDDDGNVDDRRLAGWVMIGIAGFMSLADLFATLTANENIVIAFLASAGLMMGVTVFEKLFKRS